ADPRAESGERNVGWIAGIADHREGGEEIPDRAPVRGTKPLARGHRCSEEDVDGIGDDCRGEHCYRDERAEGHVHEVDGHVGCSVGDPVCGGWAKARNAPCPRICFGLTRVGLAALSPPYISSSPHKKLCGSMSMSSRIDPFGFCAAASR